MVDELAVVMLSGGIDSSTVLGLACEEHGPDNTYGIIYRYGQRHGHRECTAAYNVAKYYGIQIRETMLTLGSGGLTSRICDIPRKSYAELGPGVSPTYVPYRNGSLLSVAVSFADSIAMKRSKDQRFCVYYGAHADDAAGNAYPDCTAEFVEAQDRAVDIGTYGRGRILAPFIKYPKSFIIKQGMQIGVPYQLTWSCYRGGDVACGKCPTCIDRLAAFKANDITDPIEYMEQS